MFRSSRISASSIRRFSSLNLKTKNDDLHSSTTPSTAAQSLLQSIQLIIGSKSASSSSLASTNDESLNSSSAPPPPQVDRATIWALWNEGNLFSLNATELSSFLQQNSVEVPDNAKKTALVRLVEDLMAKENPNAFGNAATEVDTLRSIAKETDKRASDDVWTDSALESSSSSSSSAPGSSAIPAQLRGRLNHVYDESDFYGDWSVVGQNVALREDGSQISVENVELVNKLASGDDDFIAFSGPTERAHKGRGVMSPDFLAPKGYQFLHEKAVSDFGLYPVNSASLPGCAHLPSGSTIAISEIDGNEANKIRFRSAFHWAVSNAWAANREAEINIGAGRVLYWDGASKDQRAVVPAWVLQQHLKEVHPYRWMALAHEKSVVEIEKLVADFGMLPANASSSSTGSSSSSSSTSIQLGSASSTRSGEVENSYKISLRVPKIGGFMEAEVNENFETTHVYRPWLRFLVSHYVRENMPDLRFLVRGRCYISRKDSDPIFRSPIIRESGKSVQPVLSPELGDVTYVAHRAIRRWSTRIGRGTRIMLVETRRTPLITTIAADDAERIEYELLANIPRPEDNVDLNEFADELWDQGLLFAMRLEESLEDFHSYVMKAATFL